MNRRHLELANAAPMNLLLTFALGATVKRSAKLARIRKHVTCDVWRHTCATHLIQNQANVRHVQEMLGHRSLSTTERYLHLTIADLKAAHKRFHLRERGA